MDKTSSDEKTLLTGDETEPPAAEPPVSEPEVEAAEGNTLLTGQEGEAAAVEVEIPEGVEVDEGLIEALKETSKDSESAQKLFDKFVEWQTAQQERNSEALRERMKTQLEEWETQIRSDKDFEASLTSARAAMQQFGDEELRKRLDLTGFGSDPAFFRFFAKVGKALAENSVAGTNTAGAGNSKDPSYALFDHPTSRL